MKLIANESNVRLDIYLNSNMPNVSRSKIANLIKANNILVNKRNVKPGYMLKENDVIEVNYIEEELNVLPEKIDFEIVYEDNDIIVVNKPNGLVVHPAIGNRNHTLVNALMYHSKELSNINGEFRPGIVHRIDAYTTGLLLIAKNNHAHEFLAKQLKTKTIARTYIALVWGIIKNDTGTINAPIGRDSKDRKKMAVTDINSKSAITHFKVLKRMSKATLIEVNLETGRTHQIRVHMNFIGHPIVNDPIYCSKNTIDNSGQCLHAQKISFIHPKTNKKMEFTCELPTSFTNILKMFENDDFTISPKNSKI